MIPLLLFSLLMINVVPSSPTIAGLYQIGRDALRNTLNSAIDLPKKFLQGYNSGLDLPSRVLLDRVIRILEVFQGLIRIILDMIFTPANVLIYPVDAVIEGTLNMIPVVRLAAQLMDKLIFGFNDRQGYVGKMLSDVMLRFGQKLGQARRLYCVRGPTGLSVSLRVDLGNSIFEISDATVMSLFDQFVSSATSLISSLPDVILQAKMTLTKGLVSQPRYGDARASLNGALEIQSDMIASLSQPNEYAVQAASLFYADTQMLLDSLNVMDAVAAAENVSRSTTSSVLLLDALVSSRVDKEYLSSFYSTYLNGLINAVGSVSLEIYLSTGSSTQVRNFLLKALEPLNMSDSITERLDRLGSSQRN